ncbi:hypothetical protein KIN20_038457 [Parelaphostrongylus tenuis]|uniref:PiggyBac transposable element-derived protein domain-containing protein n=1 Tax=Parelaphostrongylus tenuis TaxID=148309 RepID=A0AAD5RB69_PARTN|nr:hypothetical protein KIN20_038457 [Parelaphostrongylus tenuis]
MQTTMDKTIYTRSVQSSNLSIETAKESTDLARNVCIEEFLVPFRGKIELSQRIQNRRHKYGVKMFKLRTRSGYTYSVTVHAGTETSRTGTMTEPVVMKLMDGLLDEGRIVFTENSYTSVSLAERLLERKTHLIGMCRKKSKGLPRQVILQRLKKGQLKAQQNKSGVMVLKCKDKKDVILISTVHDSSLCASTSRPQVLESYNQGKISVDTREKMSSHSPYVRRTSKWYIRLFFHLVTQTCLVNAWRIYCENVRKITIYEFTAQVYMSLFELDKVKESTPPSGHILEDIGGDSRKRRRCVGCYRKLSKCHDSKSAAMRTKQVRTRCSKCLRHFCLDCFNNVHRKCEV